MKTGLIKQAKKLPDSPGVYLFLNKKKEVLYVGRAVSLKKRILNYFQKKTIPPPKLRQRKRAVSKLKFLYEYFS